MALWILFSLVPCPALAQPTTEEARAALRLDLDAQHRTALVQRQHTLASAIALGHPLDRTLSNGRHLMLQRFQGIRPVYLTTLNQKAATLTRTDNLYPGASLGLSLTGQGFSIGMWDAGLPRTTHQEFAGRIQTLDMAAPQDHSTHVAGTLIATGLRTQARGMAFQARLLAYDWINDITELDSEGRRGLLLSNHAYGPLSGWTFGDIEETGQALWYWFGDPTISTVEDYAFGRYDQEAVDFDRVAFANPYLLPVTAAGNDREDTGPSGGSYRTLGADGRWHTASATNAPPPDGSPDGFDTLAGQATAKNILTVGAVGLRPDGRALLSAFTSFGPTDDGRVKPDLMGLGELVFSTFAGSDADYGFSSGTSMATPNVAGSLLLLQQHQFNVRGTYLRAASLKGLAIHTAQDLLRPGPDYRTGWGLLDATAALNHLNEALLNPVGLFEGTLANQGSETKTIRVDTPGTLRITLSWTDPPSTTLPLNGPAALDRPTPRLIHDLDLRLVHQDTGDRYFPYVLTPTTPDQDAAAGDNRVDPIEQIYIPWAEPGAYDIEITHKGALTTATQDFTLLVTGGQDTFRPVVVGHLQASSSIGTVDLQWQTPFEQIPGFFRLERATLTVRPGIPSEPGPYTFVGTVPATGSPTTAAQYHFQDTAVPTGWQRYRVFFEGQGTRYLATETEIRVPAPPELQVLGNYPNPSVDQTTVILDLPRASAVRLYVVNALGQRVAAVDLGVLPSGRHALPLQTNEWAAGLYLVQFVAESTVTHHRFVVHR